MNVATDSQTSHQAPTLAANVLPANLQRIQADVRIHGYLSRFGPKMYRDVFVRLKLEMNNLS